MDKHLCYTIREHVDCTREERLSCVPLIGEILRLSEFARNKDLSRLESEAGKVSHALLKQGLLLAVDGTDPRLTEEIMNISIVYSHKTGVELLKDIIILDGVLSIQTGYNARLIETRLLSYLGEDVFEDAQKIINEFY